MISYSSDKLFNALVVPEDRRLADPWRIYQDVDLLDTVCHEIVLRLLNEPVDVLAGVSDLGFPLAIALSAQFSDDGENRPQPVLFVTDSVPIDGDWVHPHIDLSGKRVILCDDLMAGGGHMLECLRRLDAVGAVCAGAVVLLDNGLVKVRTSVDEIRRRLGDNLITLVKIGVPVSEQT